MPNPFRLPKPLPTRLTLFAVSLFLLLPASHAQLPSNPAPAPLVLQDIGRATQPLDGPWQFHLGDNPAWSSPTLDDSTWASIQAGQPWEAQGYYGYTGIAWYRRHLILAPGGSKDLHLALFLPSVDSACDVYWNGRLVGSIGKLPPHPVWYIEQPPSAFTLGAAHSGVLAIRVWRAPIIFYSFPDEGGLVAIPQAGSVQAIAGLQTAAHYRWLRSNQLTLAVVLLSCVIALLSLLMWLRNRDRTLLLWLAIVMVNPLEQLCIVGVPGLIPFRLGYGIIGLLIGLYEIALWFLLLALLGLYDRPRLVRWTKILSIVLAAFDLLDGSLQLFDWTRGHAHLFLLGDIWFTTPTLLLELWGLVLVLAAFRKRLDATRWILAIAALLANLYQAADDITGLGIRWTHWISNARLHAPIFSIAGSPVNVHDITGAFLLIAILYAAWRYTVEQTQRQSALEQEYHSAQEIQRVLIPETLPTLPAYAVTSAYRPAQEVGGDFFQLIPLPNRAALIVLGDVSGKGLRAAMAVSFIVGVIRSTVETTADPAALLTALNRRLHGRLHGGFATCLALYLDANGSCQLANAGHLPPYLNGAELPLPPALPLGLIPDADYEPTHVQMSPNDRLTLYTDGLLEARNPAGELFGFTRIAELLTTTPEAPQIADAAQHFGQEDDITILAITFAAA